MNRLKNIIHVFGFIVLPLLAHGQNPPERQELYDFVNQQLSFLGNPPDGSVPYFQKEAVVNILRAGEKIDAIFFDRIQQMNTDMIDSLLTVEDIRWMKTAAETQNLHYWSADSLHIGNIVMLESDQMMRTLYKEKNKVGFALSPPYFSPDKKYAFIMLQRRAASEGWDSLMLWHYNGKQWKVIDSKMWLWHQVEVVVE